MIYRALGKHANHYTTDVVGIYKIQDNVSEWSDIVYPRTVVSVS
jgi:hypothetical protein